MLHKDFLHFAVYVKIYNNIIVINTLIIAHHIFFQQFLCTRA